MKKVIPIILILVIGALNAQAQWEQCNRPYGGRINCLAVSGKTILAGATSGVYRSTDDGISWSLFAVGLINKDINSLFVSDTTIFAATNKGLYRSTDNGNTWDNRQNGLVNLAINSFAKSETTIFAATNKGLYRSTDNGNMWQVTGFADQYIGNCATSGMNLYVGTKDGLYRSTDNGETWNMGDTVMVKNIYFVAVSGTNIYVSTFNGVFRSNDKGDSWFKVESMPFIVHWLYVSGSNVYAWDYDRTLYRYEETNSTLTKITVNNLGVRALIVKDTILFAGTEEGVYRSTDNGISWYGLDSKETIEYVRSLLVHSGTVFAGTDNGIYRSTNNGDMWIDANVGLTDTKIRSFLAHGNIIFAGTDKGIYRSTNNGDTWSAIGMKDHEIASLVLSGNIIFAGTSARGIYRSYDNGDTWNFAGLSGHNVYSLVANTEMLFAGTWGRGVYRSIDNGQTWNITGLSNKNVLSLVVNGKTLFAGLYPDFAHYSTDNGDTWSSTTSADYAFSFAVTDESIFAGTQKRVYRLMNNEDEWGDIGLSGLDVRSLVISGDYLFAGTYGSGVWKRSLKTTHIEQREEIKNHASNLRIYPNPSEGTLTLEIEEINATSDMYDVMVYDMYGRQLGMYHTHNRQTLDLTHIPTGQYQLKVRNMHTQNTFAPSIFSIMK